MWLLVCFWKNNQYFCGKRIPYHWWFKNKPDALSIRDQEETQRIRCPVTYADGQSKYFSGSVKINWHWTVTRSVLRREFGGTSCWCCWHIIYVLQELMNSAPLKTVIIGSLILSDRNSINIYFNVHGKTLTLIHS